MENIFLPLAKRTAARARRTVDKNVISQTRMGRAEVRRGSLSFRPILEDLYAFFNTTRHSEPFIESFTGQRTTRYLELQTLRGEHVDRFRYR
jgi:hypothetical protein